MGRKVYSFLFRKQTSRTGNGMRGMGLDWNLREWKRQELEE